MRDFARPEDERALRALWEACFGGPDSYIDFYYKKRFRPLETLVWRENETPVSMMTLMDVMVNGEKGAYVYAVATLPAYRGRGLMRTLDDWAKEVILARGGCFSTLVPAGPELFPMYEKLGYRMDFPVWQRKIRAPAANSGRFSSCPFESFAELRDAYLKRFLAGVSHPPEEFRYIYDELYHCGGEVLGYEEDGAARYVCVSRDEDSLLIREITGREPVKIARQLLHRFGLKRGVIRYGEQAQGFKRVPYGMGRYLKGNATLEDHFGGIGYMALMLD